MRKSRNSDSPGLSSELGRLADVLRVVVLAVEGEAARAPAFGECVEQAAVAVEASWIEGIDPFRAEDLSDLTVFAGDLRFAGAIEAVVAVAATGVVGRIVADACCEDGACGLGALVLH
jgi:hypothetical protein